MNVNCRKTEVVLFNKQFLSRRSGTFRYNGLSLVESNAFVYLGVVFHSKGPTASAKQAMKRRMDKARAALFAMIGTCQGLKIADAHILSKLFDTLCVPCLLYGVEQWGPEMLVNNDLLQHQGLERLHGMFMRMVLGVKKSTPLHSMRSELKRHPLAMDCIAACTRFWNKLAKADPQGMMLGPFCSARRLMGSVMDV